MECYLGSKFYVGYFMAKPLPLRIWDRRSRKVVNEFMDDSKSTYEARPRRSPTQWLSDLSPLESKSGKRNLNASISHFDPERTCPVDHTASREKIVFAPYQRT